MNSKELLDLIKLGEGYNLEFKESLNNISNSICAFSNSSNGQILVGVKDNGVLVHFNYICSLKVVSVIFRLYLKVRIIYVTP